MLCSQKTLTHLSFTMYESICMLLNTTAPENNFLSADIFKLYLFVPLFLDAIEKDYSALCCIKLFCSL